jgi:hypothetical protein
MSLGDWLDEATPRQARVPVCFDGELLSRLEEAKARSVEASLQPMLGDEKKMEARAEVEELEAEVKAKTRVFVFSSIGWGRWRDLVSKHPPRPEAADIFEQAVEMKLLPRGFSELETDETTFVPAVLVATCVEPGIASTGEAMKLLESVPTGIVSRIWDGILKVNHGGMQDPFVEGFIDSAEALASEKK